MRNLSRTVTLALAAVAGAGAQSWHTYTTSVSNQTSLTVTNAQHAMNSARFGITAVTSGGVTQVPGENYTASIDPGDYKLTLSWPYGFTGNVRLRGPFPETNECGDFALHADVNEYAEMCPACSSSAPAVRTYQGKIYAGLGTSYFYPGYGSSVVRVFFEKNTVVWGLSASPQYGSGACQTTDEGLCEVRNSVTGYPSGTLPIGYFEFDSDGVEPYSAVDQRPDWSCNDFMGRLTTVRLAPKYPALRQ